jgi:hypothetical protein
MPALRASRDPSSVRHRIVANLDRDLVEIDTRAARNGADSVRWPHGGRTMGSIIEDRAGREPRDQDRVLGAQHATL